jgi:hypothetical protein
MRFNKLVLCKDVYQCREYLETLDTSHWRVFYADHQAISNTGDRVVCRYGIEGVPPSVSIGCGTYNSVEFLLGSLKNLDLKDYCISRLRVA